MQTARLFQFWRNYRAVHTNIVHFQLRNLVWATSAHDVYVMLDSCINHWSTLSRQSTQVGCFNSACCPLLLCRVPPWKHAVDMAGLSRQQPRQ